VLIGRVPRMAAGECLRARAQREKGAERGGDGGASGVEEIHGDLVDAGRRFLSGSHYTSVPLNDI
jgi:hypothetical protein